jgi:hypothetical protein
MPVIPCAHPVRILVVVLMSINILAEYERGVIFRPRCCLHPSGRA